MKSPERPFGIAHVKTTAQFGDDRYAVDRAHPPDFPITLHALDLRCRCTGRLGGKKPLRVPSLIKATARSRSNCLLCWLSSAMMSAIPITARAEMSEDANA